MKTLLCAILTLASAFDADPVVRFQSVPHAVLADGINPGLMPGVAGVGVETTGLPCAGCYDAPTGDCGDSAAAIHRGAGGTAESHFFLHRRNGKYGRASHVFVSDHRG
jgi:hypothetical protein